MKSCVVIFEDGFEEIEALTVVDIMRRAGLKCDMCYAQAGKMAAVGAHNVRVETDVNISNADFDSYDSIILPGGPAANSLKLNKIVIEEVKKFYDSKRLVCAICAAPIVLSAAGIIKNKNITSYPGYEDELSGCIYCEDIVIQDDNIITSRGPATAMSFAYKIIENLCSTAKADELKAGMLY